MCIPRWHSAFVPFIKFNAADITISEENSSRLFYNSGPVKKDGISEHDIRVRLCPRRDLGFKSRSAHLNRANHLFYEVSLLMSFLLISTPF